MRTGALIVLALSLTGCAAVFRGSKDHVRVESNPPGAEAKNGERKLGPTPAEVDAERGRVTAITVTKDGYEDHRGVVKKDMNAAWLTLDIITCIPLLCVPLFVDAITGAWYDVEKRYVATMKPRTAASVAAVAAGAPPPVTASTASTAAASGAPAGMSESERKATARAAYLEGIAHQEKGGCAEALPRFEIAQKFYSAPTHLLHIAQCQSQGGKLVEASETYETLVRIMLAKDAPEAFREAQETGKKELALVKPRIPSLRVRTIPTSSSLSSLVVKLNDQTMPNEVLGIARPVNPGHYKVTVWAAGYKEAISEVDVGEGTAKAVELTLSK